MTPPTPAPAVVPEQPAAGASTQSAPFTTENQVQPKQPAAKDVSTMSLRELKIMLDEHHVDYSQCVEKREFRALAARCLAIAAPAIDDAAGIESHSKQSASTSSDAKSQLVNWGKQRTRVTEARENTVDAPSKSTRRRQSWWKKAK